jgi:hypothetical protein
VASADIARLLGPLPESYIECKYFLSFFSSSSARLLDLLTGKKRRRKNNYPLIARMGEGTFESLSHRFDRSIDRSTDSMHLRSYLHLLVSQTPIICGRTHRAAIAKAKHMGMSLYLHLISNLARKADRSALTLFITTLIPGLIPTIIKARSESASSV